MVRMNLIAVFGLGVLAAGVLLMGDFFPAWAGPAPGAAAPQADESRMIRTITVVGEGKVSVRPDVAKATVGVVVVAPTVKVAMARSHASMVAVLAALKKAGVAEKDIITSNYSIYYETPPPAGKQGGSSKREGESKGRYHVNNMVLVTIRDMDKVDAVLDAVTEAGANQVWGVNFVVDNTDSTAARARELAAAQARAKAEELARLHGVRLGPVISVSEVVGGLPIPLAHAAMTEMGAGGPISPGELTFSAQLQVVYGIE